MKKISRLLALTLTALLAGGCAAGGQETDLTVFAAASMTETLNELKPLFEEKYPGVTVIYNFDSSGTLKTQIEEGAVCDVFISAGQKQMDELNVDILADSRMNLLENEVTLCVSVNASAEIDSFDDLADRLKDGSVLLCVGNSDVPVGQYTQKILAYYGLDESALANAGLITYASNVKEVTTQILEGSVDCGVIYRTDAYSAGLAPVDHATADMCGQVIYPAAVLDSSQNQEIAKKFLDFLTTTDAKEIFGSVGFSPLR